MVVFIVLPGRLYKQLTIIVVFIVLPGRLYKQLTIIGSVYSTTGPSI